MFVTNPSGWPGRAAWSWQTKATFTDQQPVNSPFRLENGTVPPPPSGLVLRTLIGVGV